MTYNEEIKKCENLLLEAISKNDFIALDELLHDDLLFNSHDGTTITKKMDLEVYRTGKLQIQEVIATGQKISIIGDNAVVITNMRLQGLHELQAFSGTFLYLRVWKRSADKWKVIAGSCHLI